MVLVYYNLVSKDIVCVYPGLRIKPQELLSRLHDILILNSGNLLCKNGKETLLAGHSVAAVASQSLLRCAAGT